MSNRSIQRFFKIIFSLSNKQFIGASDVVNQHPSISSHTVYSKLNKLAEDGYLEKRTNPGLPTTTEYKISKKGKSWIDAIYKKFIQFYESEKK